MNQFVDKSGQAWPLSITIGAARRVLNKLGVNLLDPSSKTDNELGLSQRLLYDDLFLLDVVGTLLEPQLTERALDKERFFDCVDGATVKRIEETFWKEYLAFFKERGKEWAEKALVLDLETKQKAAETALAEIDGISSIDSPEGAESTPTD